MKLEPFHIPAALLACYGAAALAQTTETTLPPVVVKGSGTASVAAKDQLPTTTESVTAAQAAETVNAVNTEDLVKYLPNVLVRKRFIGDTQAPISSRTTGINASARTLILADGVSLSTLIGNNNSGASPRWFMVSPEEVERIDVMYGPFAAQYPGNSYGGVIAITTRMPRRFEGSVKLGYGSQDFNLYGTGGSYASKTAAATLGSRSGDLSWWLSLNHLDSHSQPITFGTLSALATQPGSVAGLPVASGSYSDFNRTGMPIQVVSAGTITHTVQDSAKLKLAYDFPGAVTAAYTLGYWHNQASTDAQSYLNVGGAPYYGAGSGNVVIGGQAYSASAIAGALSSSRTEQEHLMQALALRSNTQGVWDWEAIVSNYRYLGDVTRSSTGFSSAAPNLYPGAMTGGSGRIADSGGTGWTTLDLKGVWRPAGSSGTHVLSFGAHHDRYSLVNPTYNAGDWVSGAAGALFSDSRGKTETDAVWAQDVWRLGTALKATLGGRYEQWRASGGRNVNTAGATATAPGTQFAVDQPSLSASGLSPKASLAWAASPAWQVTGSVGKALRFATVGELYQNVATGSTFTQANPFLRPENVLSSELAFERALEDGRLRVSLFDERVRDALISQTAILNGTLTSFVQNVDKTHQQGIELVVQKEHVVLRGLELGGSVTYVDGRIVANSGYVPSTPGATSVGKRTPYIPDWRATAVATYRPDDRWALTLAGRYSGRMYATVDNTDINPATYTGFQGFFVADLRVHYQVDRHWSAAFGIDNLNNRKYWLYHPFPQRSWLAEARYSF